MVVADELQRRGRLAGGEGHVDRESIQAGTLTFVGEQQLVQFREQMPKFPRRPVGASGDNPAMLAHFGPLAVACPGSSALGADAGFAFRDVGAQHDLLAAGDDGHDGVEDLGGVLTEALGAVRLGLVGNEIKDWLAALDASGVAEDGIVVRHGNEY